MTDVLILEKHRELFKDDESVRKFAELLEAATKAQAMRLLLFGERLVGAIISTAEAQSQLQERIAARLIQDPKSIDVLTGRLQSDDLVPFSPAEPDAAPQRRSRRRSGRDRPKAGKK